MLELLIRYRHKADLRAAEKSGARRWAKCHTCKDASELHDAVFDALIE